MEPPPLSVRSRARVGRRPSWHGERRLRPRPIAALTRWAVVAVSCAALIGPTPAASAAPLADGNSLRQELAAVEAELNIARVLYEQRRDEQRAAGARIDELLGDRDTSLDRVVAVLGEARDLAVDVYMRGHVEPVQYLLNSGTAAELAWRQSLTIDRVSGARQAASQFVTLREQLDVQTFVYAESLDAAQRLVGEAEQRVDALTERAARLRTEIEGAQLAEEQARRRATREGQARESEARWDTPSQYGLRPEPTDGHWHQLRHCEATGNYGAISLSGLYRGAYQFDVSTWATMGGAGDPAAGSRDEQDARARALYQARGNQPWPVCGRFLP